MNNLKMKKKKKRCKEHWNLVVKDYINHDQENLGEEENRHHLKCGLRLKKSYDQPCINWFSTIYIRM